MRPLFIGISLIIIMLIIAVLLFSSFSSYIPKEEKLNLPHVSSKEVTITKNKPISHLIKETKNPVYYYSTNNVERAAYTYEVSVPTTKPTSPAPESPTSTTSTSPITDALLKYVLFSVYYEPQMNAGETKSFKLKMSPRSELSNLQQALKNKTIQQNQINEIEKVRNDYKYVSAELIANDNCVHIEKKIPDEDKVYLPGINESSADQIWQWDLTAPEQPLTKVCHVSLFIRFCLNQNDCLPTTNPDKELYIYIQISLAHKAYIWLTSFGTIANVGITILTLIGMIVGWSAWFCRKKRSVKKLTTHSKQK